MQIFYISLLLCVPVDVNPVGISEQGLIVRKLE